MTNIKRFGHLVALSWALAALHQGTAAASAAGSSAAEALEAPEEECRTNACSRIGRSLMQSRLRVATPFEPGTISTCMQRRRNRTCSCS